MAKKIYYIFLVILVALTSCEDIKIPVPISTFDTPFPKRNIKLTNILGDQLTIRNSGVTSVLKITSGKNRNLIINNTGDTIFYGTVSRFRGLYYFSQQINDTSYWIHVVRIADNLIYGLNDCMYQLWSVDEAIKSGKNQKLIKYINADTTIIRLHPEKREMKNLYRSFLTYFPPDTILNFEETIPVLEDTTKAITAIDPEDFSYILKAYPNPATDILNIELQQKSKSTFQLSDLNGKTILQGPLNEIVNKIDISKQQAGIYALTIINAEDNQKETVKIVKTE